MNFNLLVKPLGIWLTQFEGLLKLASWFTPWGEIAIPMLLWVPSWNGRVRTLAILALLGLNAGIWLTMDVGYFMFYSSAALLCLLPPVFWDTLAPITFRIRETLQKSGTRFGNQLVTWVERETQAVVIPAGQKLALDIKSKLQAAAMIWVIFVMGITGSRA